MRQVLVRGIPRVDQMFVLTMAAYNLTRLRGLGQIRLSGQMWGVQRKKSGSRMRKTAPWSAEFQNVES